MTVSRILVITQPYVPDPSTAGQHLHSAAQALVVRGHTVVVLAADRGYEDPKRRYPRREVRDGVEIRRLPLSSLGKGNFILRMVAAVSFVTQSALRGLIYGPDAILVYTTPPIAPAAALVISKLRRTPICYWVGDLNPDQAIRLNMLKDNALVARVMNQLNRMILRSAKRVVVLDHYMAERVKRKLNVEAKMVSIPPWAHNDDTEWVPHEHNPWRNQHIEEGRFVVMFSGNHSLAHPLRTLLDAALRLGNEPFEFLFVGGGTGKREVEQLIDRERPPNIRTMPYQPFETLRFSLAAADVHVMAMGDDMVGISHPCKIYGALAAGRPILLIGPSACHAGNIVEENSIGWRVAHGDVDAAVAALRSMPRTSPQDLEAMGRKAQQLVRHRYSKEVLRNRFCDVVEDVLDLPLSTKAATMPSPPPSVSIVIPARNAVLTIGQALDSALQQDYAGSVEIVVADGSDTDALAHLVQHRYPTVRLVRNDEHTTSTGLNAAIRASTGEVVVRCDAQTILAQDYVRRAVETLVRTGAANVGSRQRPEGIRVFQRAVALAMATAFGGDFGHRRNQVEGPTDTVYLGVFRRDALDAVGGFNVAYIRHQDYELNWRLRERGETVWFEPALRTVYRPRETLRKLLIQYFGYGQWKWVMLRQYPASLRLRHLIIPTCAFLALVVAGLSVLRGPWFTLMPLIAYVIGLLVSGAIIGFRRRDVAAVLVPIVLATMHFSWGAGFFLPRRLSLRRAKHSYTG